MNLLTISKNSYSFNALNNQQNHEKENPISRKGEAINLTKATFIAGLGLGTKLLFDVLDDDFIFKKASDKAINLVEKNKSNASSFKKDLYKIGGTFGLIASGVGAFAILYTLLKSPNIAYDSKVNTFTKSNNMDVFIKQKRAEKEIYEQLNEQAKNSNEEEKEKLKEQYMKMQMTK